MNVTVSGKTSPTMLMDSMRLESYLCPARGFDWGRVEDLGDRPGAGANPFYAWKVKATKAPKHESMTRGRSRYVGCNGHVSILGMKLRKSFLSMYWGSRERYLRLRDHNGQRLGIEAKSFA